MATVTLKLNTRQFADATRRLRAKGHVAIVRSLKRAGVSARTVMVRDVAADIGVTQKVARDGIRVETGRVESDHAVQVVCTGARIPLIDLGARGPEPSRGRGRGVTYRLGRGGRKTIRDAFIARMRSGHRGVFTRVDPSKKKSAGAWSKNLPIDEKHGPSMVLVFRKHQGAGKAAGIESLRKNLQHEFRFAGLS